MTATSTKQILAGAAALELSDVLVIVGVGAAVVLGLIALEKYAEGELNDWLSGLTSNLQGPADGQSWWDYLFGSN